MSENTTSSSVSKYLLKCCLRIKYRSDMSRSSPPKCLRIPPPICLGIPPQNMSQTTSSNVAGGATPLPPQPPPGYFLISDFPLFPPLVYHNHSHHLHHCHHHSHPCHHCRHCRDYHHILIIVFFIVIIIIIITIFVVAIILLSPS